MDEKKREACQTDPTGDACDVVEYAEELVAEDEKNKPDMTVGKQPGFTKTTVEGVMDEYKK